MEWQPIETAPKDLSTVWAVMRADIFPTLLPHRDDLEVWNGKQVPIRHPGLWVDEEGREHDFGWNVALPVGHGGFPDAWIAGWMPLPEPPAA